MHETLRGLDGMRLERSCAPGRDWIRAGTGAAGLQRAEVRLATLGFAPHRHDTYAIGITTGGVQRFRYRGELRTCLPGQLHVLHPDETHDGRPGSEAALGYRILYVEPELVREALGGGPLPFVADPVHAAPPAVAALAPLLADLEEPVGELARASFAATVADLLRALAGRPRAADGAVDVAAVERVREHLAAHAHAHVPAATLERIAGCDRFTLARHFRRAYGTSPDRYRTLRRLEQARAAIEAGRSLADAAADAGFADQSHLTRQFKRAFGLTPGRWVQLRRAPRAAPPGR